MSLQIELKEGVVGGFAPAVLRRCITIVQNCSTEPASVAVRRIQEGFKGYNPTDDLYRTSDGSITPERATELLRYVFDNFLGIVCRNVVYHQEPGTYFFSSD